jgi:hypothetical protein
MVVNEGQMVCVELVARNPVLNDSRVLFLGSIKYEALQKVYETRVKISNIYIYCNLRNFLGYSKYSCCSTNIIRNVYETTSGIC